MAGPTLVSTIIPMRLRVLLISIIILYVPVKEMSVNVSGFIAQLVEHRTGIARSRVQPR